MKQIIDFLLALAVLFLLFIPMLIIAIAVRITSKGPILHISERVGKDNKIFRMPKFRTMLIDTPNVASHLLKNPDDYLSPIGSFLRRMSFDELPQLFSILKGDMTFIGPRPALFNQYDLISLRKERGVDKLLPGITGWAQVNGRDKLLVPDKVALDVEYLNHKSIWFDLKILWLTVLKVLKKDGVTH